MYLYSMPIVKSGTLQCPVIRLKAERTNQMQMRSRSSAGSRNISCIGWYFRLYEHDVIAHDKPPFSPHKMVCIV